MSSEHNLDQAGFLSRIRQRTPARVLVDRAGAAYRTPTLLELRQAHAAARDALRTEFDLERDLGVAFVREWKLFEVTTQARSKDEFLLRPDLGRKLSAEAVAEIKARCPRGADLQFVIGDGLSVTAVDAQVPALLPMIAEGARNFGHADGTPDKAVVRSTNFRLGQPFAIRHCRVGVMNEIGDLLQPGVLVLLIGERPGLATAESLSAYMAYRPRAGHTDAQRNLVSNIHARGVPVEQAAGRILRLAAQMIARQSSGAELKEEMPAARWLDR